mmetsp:Transcript_117900/g.320010  ORF Transcript_117900/g.320010 Transcript_117900/m.320010 type:complete len:234 (-) Transcript_117900:615-1316(-)
MVTCTQCACGLFELLLFFGPLLLLALLRLCLLFSSAFESTSRCRGMSGSMNRSMSWRSAFFDFQISPPCDCLRFSVRTTTPLGDRGGDKAVSREPPGAVWSRGESATAELMGVLGASGPAAAPSAASAPSPPSAPSASSESSAPSAASASSESESESESELAPAGGLPAVMEPRSAPVGIGSVSVRSCRALPSLSDSSSLSVGSSSCGWRAGPSSSCFCRTTTASSQPRQGPL